MAVWMTPPAKPDERGQRVKQKLLTEMCRVVELQGGSRDSYDDLMLDLRDARAALATARRDGWIEGRDAAVNEAASIPNMLLHTSPDHVRGLRGSDVAERIRALTPPVAADGGRDG